MDDANRYGNCCDRPAGMIARESPGIGAAAAREASMTGRTAKDGGKAPGISSALYLAIGWISAVASLVRYPFLFGAAAVIMGILANKSASRGALPLIAASIMLMAVGLIFGEVFYNILTAAFGI